MRPLKYIPRYTVKDYSLWEGDWELIDGIPYAMSPSPVRKHQQLGAFITLQIGNSIQKQKEVCGDCQVVYELDWILDDNTVLRPDIAVICHATGDFITAPPVLIVEILSPSTAFKDRQVKFDIYEEQGVRYYIIIDPGTKTYNFYLLTNALYVEQKNVTSFIIHDKCAVQLDLDKALAELVME
jgi:Uma2 family endonuclease